MRAPSFTPSVTESNTTRVGYSRCTASAPSRCATGPTLAKRLPVNRPVPEHVFGTHRSRVLVDRTCVLAVQPRVSVSPNRQSCGQGEDTMMVYPDKDPELEPGPQLRAAERASRAGQQAEQARRQARAAQRSAADSMDHSAISQDRTAKAFEEAAEHSDPHREDYRAYAARHREFAREDRRMARQLRQIGLG